MYHTSNPSLWPSPRAFALYLTTPRAPTFQSTTVRDARDDETPTGSERGPFAHHTANLVAHGEHTITRTAYRMLIIYSSIHSTGLRAGVLIWYRHIDRRVGRFETSGPTPSSSCIPEALSSPPASSRVLTLPLVVSHDRPNQLKKLSGGLKPRRREPYR